MRPLACTAAARVAPGVGVGPRRELRAGPSRPAGPMNRWVPRAAAQEANSTGSGLSYEHLMVTLFDSNPYLAEGSRQALATAADLAAWHRSKVTVVVVEDKGQQAAETTAMKLTTINDLLAEKGCANYEVLEKLTESNHSAVVGDVADDIAADMVVISSDTVHDHNVDANLLAEFCPCSLLLLP